MCDQTAILSPTIHARKEVSSNIIAMGEKNYVLCSGGVVGGAS